MKTIESSILALCLDNHTLGISPLHSLPKSLREIDYHLHNARSGLDARNRWFDKPITLIVESNARASVMGEHSPCDALIPSIVAEYALAEDLALDAFGHEPSTSDTCNSLERLDWVVDDHIRAETLQAGERAKAIIADSDCSVMWFTNYGADWIKNTGQSP